MPILSKLNIIRNIASLFFDKLGTIFLHLFVIVALILHQIWILQKLYKDHTHIKMKESIENISIGDKYRAELYRRLGISGGD